MKKILVLIDHGKESIHNSSWDALRMGIRLGSSYEHEVHAVVLGNFPEPAIDKLVTCDLASVKLVDDPALAEVAAEVDKLIQGAYESL